VTTVFFKSFVNKYKADGSKMNPILEQLKLKSPSDWKTVTKNRQYEITKQADENLEKCVSRCNLKDHLLDFTGVAYEENYEKHVNRKGYKKPDYSCPKCVKFLPASYLMKIPDALWEIQPAEKIEDTTKATVESIKPENKITTQKPTPSSSKHLTRPKFATAQLSQDFDEWLTATKPSTENFIYSPVSIYNILAGIYFGTGKSSETRAELQKNFNFKSNFTSTKYATELAKMTEGKVLDTFNSYVFHKEKLNPNYKKDLKILSFKNQKFKTFTGKEGKMNEIVKNDTAGLIKEMFSPGTFDDMTSMVLLNTILFKGMWDDTRGVFEETDTKTENIWYTGTNQTSKGPFNAKFMYSKNRYLRAYENKKDRVVYVSLKFKGEVGKPVWMTIAMPQLGSKVPVHKVKFNEIAWELMQNKKVHLKMPKFEIEDDHNLVDFMKHKGSTRLFSAETANLNRMFGNKDSKNFIGKFNQKAVIKVHEKGAEAAAATAAGFISKSMSKQKKTYVIKRPFKFFIHSTKMDYLLKEDEEQSANLFFAGIVNCPLKNCN